MLRCDVEGGGVVVRVEERGGECRCSCCLLKEK